MTILPRKWKTCGGDFSLTKGVIVCVQYLPERQYYAMRWHICESGFLIPSCSICATGRKMVQESGLCGLLVREEGTLACGPYEYNSSHVLHYADVD